MDPRIADVLDKMEARSATEQALLEELRARGVDQVREAAPRLMLDVGRDTGLFLNLIARTQRARRIVEVGGSVGYSTIWLADAVRASGGGVVISLEVDAEKIREQRSYLEAAGVVAEVEQICGDAAKVLPELDGPFDLVLLDHWKDLYVREFDLVWPKMRVGGVVLADNVLIPKAVAEEMRAYTAHVRSKPDARSLTVPVGMGVEMTCRTSPAS